MTPSLRGVTLPSPSPPAPSALAAPAPASSTHALAPSVLADHTLATTADRAVREALRPRRREVLRALRAWGGLL